MLLSEGTLEILASMRQAEVAYFKDLRKLKNERTGRIFSANTLSARLKELEKIRAIRKVPSTTTSGRNVVAYKITPQGVKALEISQKYEDELAKFLSK